jgi:hypothetical protein
MNELNPQQKEEWRRHHIPSRFRAAMAHTRLDPEAHQRELGNFAAEAVQMGRAIAIRWLVEFVGIKGVVKKIDKETIINAKRPDCREDDQRLDNIGGGLLDTGHSDAIALAKTWVSASKAVSHATYLSEHPELTSESISNAVEVLKNHFQATLYAKHLEDLDAFIHNSAN